MKIMPNTSQEERFRWIKPILDGEISVKNMTKVCPFSARTLKYWLANYRKHGMTGLQTKSSRPKHHPKETPIRIKERIIEMRRKTRLCALKLSWIVKKEGIQIDPRTIGKIIKNDGLVRRYRIRKIKYKYIKLPLRPGELVEIDIKFVPQKLGNKQFYQFTAIDCASRWRFLKIFDDGSSRSAMAFLEELFKIAPFKIKAIKTDNGSCFTNRYIGYLKSTDPENPRLHPFDLLCAKFNALHYLIDPGKPAQNGKVERSHRSDQENFYDRNYFKSLEDLEQKIYKWNTIYNNLEHCGLNGLTPNQALKLQVQKVRT